MGSQGNQLALPVSVGLELMPALLADEQRPWLSDLGRSRRGRLSGMTSASGSGISSVGMQNTWNMAYFMATAIALLLALSPLSMPSPITVALTLLPSLA